MATPECTAGDAVCAALARPARFLVARRSEIESALAEAYSG